MRKYEKADFIVLLFDDDNDIITASMTGKDGIIDGEENDKWE